MEHVRQKGREGECEGHMNREKLGREGGRRKREELCEMRREGRQEEGKATKEGRTGKAGREKRRKGRH